MYFWPHWPEVYVGAIPVSLPIICSESVTTAGVNRYRVSVIVHNRCVSSYICRYRTYPAVTSFIFNNNDWSADGSAENAGVENAGVENAGVDSRGGKCRSGKCRSDNLWKAVRIENSKIPVVYAQTVCERCS